MEHRIRSAAIIVQEDSESSWFGKLTTGKLTTNGMNNTARPDPFGYAQNVLAKGSP